MTTERNKQQAFWNGYSSNPNITTMMLNEKAHNLQSGDREDILRSLPILTGYDVVDIGAGIGRYTSHFAKEAKSVLAVDFIESFIDKNREINAHLGNVKFEVNDAMHLQLPPKSMDFVFTNWLLMYLTDNEVVTFLTRACRWLRPNAFLHLRESCSQPSNAKAKGDKFHATVNPTFYRQKSQYLRVLETIIINDDDGKKYKLQTDWATSVPTYIKLEGNWRQCHMLIRKKACHDDVPLKEQQLAVIGQLSLKEQESFQQMLNEYLKMLDDAQVCRNKSISEAITSLANKFNRTDTALLLHDEATLNYFVDPVKLAQKTSMRVWSVYTSIHAYRAIVRRLNIAKDSLCRSSWHDKAEKFVEHANAIYEDIESPIRLVYVITKAVNAVPIIDSIKKFASAKGARLLMVLRASQNYLDAEVIGKLGNGSIAKMESDNAFLVKCIL